MAKQDVDEILWTRESMLRVENQLLQQVVAARTVEAVEAAESYARFLRMSGLDSDNYPLFLKTLEVENHWVLDALLGSTDPFLLLSAIPPGVQRREERPHRRRRPRGLGQAMLEQQRLGRHAVEVGRDRPAEPVGAEVVRSQGIDEQEDDVGSGVGRRLARAERQQREDNDRQTPRRAQ